MIVTDTVSTVSWRYWQEEYLAIRGYKLNFAWRFFGQLSSPRL